MGRRVGTERRVGGQNEGTVDRAEGGAEGGGTEWRDSRRSRGWGGGWGQSGGWGDRMKGQ